MMDISLPPDGVPDTSHAYYFSAKFQARRINKMAKPKNELFLESNPVGALLDAAALLRFEHLLRHPIEFFQHDGLAAHSGHEGENQGALLTFVERRNSFRIERTAAAHTAEAHVGFNHADNLELAERFLDLLGRVRTNCAQPHQANFRAAFTHVLDRVTRRNSVRTLQEED